VHIQSAQLGFNQTCRELNRGFAPLLLLLMLQQALLLDHLNLKASYKGSPKTISLSKTDRTCTARHNMAQHNILL
jgi:hypothetical protein